MTVSPETEQAHSIWRAHFHDHLKTMSVVLTGMLDFEHCPDDVFKDCRGLQRKVVALKKKYDQHNWENHYDGKSS